MTDAQKTIRSNFRYYCKYRDDGGSHSSYMHHNDFDYDSEVSLLFNEMYDKWKSADTASFYRRYPFMKPRTKKVNISRDRTRINGNDGRRKKLAQDVVARLIEIYLAEKDETTTKQVAKKRLLIRAKKVMHHDDPPCNARLGLDGFCSHCHIIPDMQSLQLWAYCPDCDIPLGSEFKCSKCGKMFANPFSHQPS